MVSGSSSPSNPEYAGHEHWHVGANYPNEHCLGQIGCVSKLGEAVDIIEHDVRVSGLSPSDIVGVRDIPAYLDQIRAWEPRIREARGIAFLAGGLIFWAVSMPSDRNACPVAYPASPLL